MSRFVAAFVSLLALASALAVAPAHADAPSDTATTESWRLANGLEVRVCTIPGAAGASVTLAYRAGQLHMPAGHAGLAQLLAELQMTAAAGQVPYRSRDDLAGLRPAGWELRTTDHVVLLTEAATPAQLPGVLLQVAARAHGVQIADSTFRRALATVRATLAREELGDPDLVLHHRVRDVALGREDSRIFADAQGKGLDGIDAAAATKLLQRLYVPANATLALAGDFGNVDVHTVIARLFGDIPAGTAEPEAPMPVLRPGSRMSLRAGLALPVGVVGVIAPALDDTLHASFYLAAILAGAGWREQFEDPQPPLTSLFRYSVLEEPDLVRFFLQPAAELTDTTALVTRWGASLDELRSEIFATPVLDEARRTVDWLVGGPISPPVLRLMHLQSAPLLVLSASMATRGTWRGDAFWDAWRNRFDTTRLAPLKFLNDMLAPGHHAAVLLLPHR